MVITSFFKCCARQQKLLYIYTYIYVCIYICFDYGSTPSECQIFLFVPLRPFFYAALAKRWKVQFRNCVNLTTLIQKRHILMRTAVLYIYIYIYVCIYICFLT